MIYAKRRKLESPKRTKERNRYKWIFYGHQFQSKNLILICYSKYMRVRKIKPNPYFSNLKLLLIHLNRFISNPNPYFWIVSPIHLIGYGLDIDWIHFWIIQMNLGWTLTWPWPRLSWVNPGPSRAELARVHVKSSHLGPKSSRLGLGHSQAESVPDKVEQSRPRQKSSRVGSGQSRAK